MKTRTKRLTEEKDRVESPFTGAQNEAIRMIVAEQMKAMIAHQEPIPLLMVQRYLERIVPQIVESVINVEVDRAGVVRDIKRDLEVKGEQIMEARTEQVRQRVNDWMDKEMRRQIVAASSSLKHEIEAWMPTWWAKRAWKSLCKLVRRG